MTVATGRSVRRPIPSRRERKRQENVRYVTEMLKIMHLNEADLLRAATHGATSITDASDLELYAMREYLGNKLAEKDRAVMDRQERMTENEKKTYAEDMLR